MKASNKIPLNIRESFSQVPSYRGYRTSPRGELCEDRFEARLAAERIPERVQAQLAIAERTRKAGDGFQLLERRIGFARPRINDGEILHRQRAIDRIFRNWKQFNGATAFLDGFFFAAQSCVNDPKS